MENIAFHGRGGGEGGVAGLLFMAGALEGGGQVRAVGAVRALWAVWAVRAAGVGHGLERRKTLLFMAGALEGGGQVRAVGAVRAVWRGCFSWQGRWRGGGQCERWGAVRAVCGVGGEGGGGWAWTGARKTLLFMAGARAVGAAGAVWAVRAAGVGHGLEPVKHCFSWHKLWRGGRGKCERWGR